MRTLTLHASEWQSPLDFYESLLALLEAPHWHGTSMNALIDSMFYGGINGVEPPYKIWIKDTANLPESIRTEIGWLLEAVADHGGAEKGISVQIDP